MPLVRHKFINRPLRRLTETLIIGTFNPESEDNPADFFYSRGRNYLWTLLPVAFGHKDLKGQPVDDKIKFISLKNLDFIDLISEVDVEEETNYYDGYLDSRVVKWTDIITEIKKLPNIKRVCFTRKTFADIKNMHVRIEEIQRFCTDNKIKFQFLTTPARFYSAEKQTIWTKFLIDDH